MVALRKQGLSYEAIASQIGISRATVSRWLSQGTFPEQPARSRTQVLDPYLPYVRRRWQSGCHNIAQLHRELVARGYPHSYRSVYASLVRLLPDDKKHSRRADSLAPVSLSSRQASFLFLRRPEKLTAEDQAALLTLRHLHPELELAYDLGQQFARMLRTRTGAQLDDWLAQVRASPIRELQDFVAGVERDQAAVVAGLTLVQSNGVVEGHVNKLKLLKRMMYGRANFPLVRQRVLHAV
jgi:transposase